MACSEYDDLGIRLATTATVLHDNTTAEGDEEDDQPSTIAALGIEHDGEVTQFCYFSLTYVDLNERQYVVYVSELDWVEDVKDKTIAKVTATATSSQIVETDPDLIHLFMKGEEWVDGTDEEVWEGPIGEGSEAQATIKEILNNRTAVYERQRIKITPRTTEILPYDIYVDLDDTITEVKEVVAEDVNEDPADLRLF